ncbi:MAG: hypothetical protein COV66_03500 [Nitrospinae bacterium CG11_big_fil_rev_8_21_14_0_20_45_15]|nr:MAG: hypothetical protein COV66_03500 [Nitrospinae bacterium CG11_big_fil_rev_8_21_14_0_20_45_15]
MFILPTIYRVKKQALIPPVMGLLCVMLSLFSAGCGSIGKKIPDLGQSFKEIVMEKIAFKENVVPATNLAPPQNSKLSEKNRPDLDFAQKNFRLGNFEVAEYYFSKVLLTNPQDPDALRELSWTYFYQKDYVKALNSFRRGETFSPKSIDPLIGKGWTLFALKRYEEAISVFQKAEEFTEDRRQITKALGFCFLLMNRQDDARQEFLKIYSEKDTADLIDESNQWFAKSPSPTPDIFSFQPGKFSLFTLPTEFPRHLSALVGFAEEPSTALDEPWRLYHKSFFDWAIDAFQKEIAKGNDNVDARNGLAWSYLGANRISDAEAVFDDILKYLPLFSGALKGKIEVHKAKTEKASVPQFYFDRGKDQIAEKEYLELSTKFPDWSHPVIQLGKIKLRMKEWQAAWDLFQKARKIDPDSPEVQDGLKMTLRELRPKLYKAQVLMESGDYKKASHIYFDYIEDHEKNPSDPFLAVAYNQLGWGQFRKKQYDLAEQKFEIAKKYSDFELDSIKGAGMSAFNAGDFIKAEGYLNTVYEANPEVKEVAYLHDQSVRKGLPGAQALHYFRTEIKKFPLRASIYMEMGWLIHQQGDPALAVEYFAKAISLDPNVAVNSEFEQLLQAERFGWQVYNQMGWAYFQKKMLPQSMQMFNIALARQPNRSEARMGLAYNYFEMGNLDQSAELLQQTLILNPTPKFVWETVSNAIGVVKMQTTVRTKLGRIYIAQNRNQEALNQFRKVLQVSPNLPEALDGLGWALFNLNRLLEARATFALSIEMEPLNNQSHIGLSRVKEQIVLEKMDRTRFFSTKLEKSNPQAK